MKKVNSFLVATALTLVLATPALAQEAAPGANLNAGTETQRDVNQQDRIEDGLKDGQLSTKESAQLEKGEAKIDKTEAKDMKDGTLSPQEKAQIQKEQNAESKKIYRDTHNGVKGNPNSASSKRMQADVQRDANQEQRIHNGVKNGSLTNKETGKLERGEGRMDRQQYRAGRDGHVGKREQRRMERRENRESHKVWRKKHNEHKRK